MIQCKIKINKLHMDKIMSTKDFTIRVVISSVAVVVVFLFLIWASAEVVDWMTPPPFKIY